MTPFLLYALAASFSVANAALHLQAQAEIGKEGEGDFAPGLCLGVGLLLGVVALLILFVLLLGLFIVVFVAFKIKSDSAPAPRHFKG